MQISPLCPAKYVGPKIRISSGSIGTPPGLIPCVTPLITHVEAGALMPRAFKCVTMLAFLGSQSALQANCSCTCVTPSSPLRLQRFALLADRGPTCGKVNNGIPDSLKWENASTSNTQSKTDPVPMGQAVESIDRTWYPGDENCKPKDEAGPQVSHLDGIKPLEFQRCVRLDSSKTSNNRQLLMWCSVGCAYSLEALRFLPTISFNFLAFQRNRP